MVTCPLLPTDNDHQTLSPENANTYDTTVIFWCDVGYQFHDGTTARSIKCLEDGQWSAELPECTGQCVQPVRGVRMLVRVRVCERAILLPRCMWYMMC